MPFYVLKSLDVLFHLAWETLRQCKGEATRPGETRQLMRSRSLPWCRPGEASPQQTGHLQICPFCLYIITQFFVLLFLFSHQGNNIVVAVFYHLSHLFMKIQTAFQRCFTTSFWVQGINTPSLSLYFLNRTSGGLVLLKFHLQGSE